MNKDYHDYVIRNGEFVGKFEEMYQSCEDPWGQKYDVVTSYSKMASVVSLKRIKAASVLEIGCGLGYYTHFLELFCPESRFVGMDISKTAIEKARNNFPNMKFIQGDVKNLESIISFGEYDALIFSEIMWYILDDLKSLLETLQRIHSGKYILVNQTFYNGGQKYGRQYFTTPSEMISFMGFPCISNVVEHISGEGKGYASHSLFLVN